MTRSRPPVLAQQTFRQNEAELSTLDLAGKFRFIHRTNMWGSPETTSGVGSTSSATTPIRRGIANICHEYQIRSLLDATCGDCTWIAVDELPIEHYVGVDIVPELIEQNRKRHSGAKTGFLTADLTRDDLPCCELILCRDCLVHLGFANVRKVLQNFRRSGARFLLTTTFHEHDVNTDIADGDWRLLNLESEPFRFPKPILMIDEECDEIEGSYRDKSLALWEITSLPL